MADKKVLETEQVRVYARLTIPQIDPSEIEDLRKALQTIASALPGAQVELTVLSAPAR